MEFVLVVATALVLDRILLVLIYDFIRPFFAISVITRVVGMERKPTEPHFQWLRWFLLPSNSSGNDTDSKKFSYEVINQNQQDSVKYPSSGNNKHEFHGVTLSLVDVTKKDEGKYTCIVGNVLGYSVKNAYIIVQEKLGKIVLMLK